MIYTAKQAKKLGVNQTIDLKTQLYREHVKKIDSQDPRTTLKHYLNIILNGMGIMFIGFILILLIINKSNASFNNLSIGDKIRLERLEVCQEAFDKWKIEKDLPTYIRYKQPVVSCALRMHGVYIQESGAGTSEMCKNNKSCLGIKTKRNGYYGHNPFNTYREEREIFADKYFEKHYKKSPRTFIYGYLQQDGTYRWGWATGNKEPYTILLETIENNKELIREYEYLYMNF